MSVVFQESLTLGALGGQVDPVAVTISSVCPLSITIDCRNLRVKRRVSITCSAELTPALLTAPSWVDAGG
jgi:hypothetical protein